ncbi:MAG: hypothetical protein II595_07095, partial [Desulfovibrio sp.]|nr:hypothetical protein [Desulfovibrio sp.]
VSPGGSVNSRSGMEMAFSSWRGVPKRWRTKDLCLATVRNGGHLYDVPDALLTPELLEAGKNAFSS